jgi:hypothetical protein
MLDSADEKRIIENAHTVLGCISIEAEIDRKISKL